VVETLRIALGMRGGWDIIRHPWVHDPTSYDEPD
jgi:hypothetical protein